MTKTIRVYYTLLTNCEREIEVDENVEFTSKTANELYHELIEKFPEENLKEIEEDYVYNFDAQDFGGIDRIDIISDNPFKLEEVYPKKSWFKIQGTNE